MRNRHTEVDLEKILRGTQLPALPQSAIRLLELSQDPDNGPSQFSIPIEADPGLASQVLRFVNSSYFGFRHEISNIKLAISLVGIRTIKNFALWSAVFSVMPNLKSGPLDVTRLWQDSLRRGIFARRIGRVLKLEFAEDLFAVALLQDLAVPLLAKELPNDYTTLLNARKQSGERLSNLEREHFGWTHADAGAIIARTWHLPESFAIAIEQHVQEFSSGGVLFSGGNIVALSSMLPSISDASWIDREVFLQSFERFGQPPVSEVESIFEQVDKDFAEFAPVLKLPTPGISLQGYFQASVATS